MKARNRSGFTLVEILIVVVILGILAAIVIPQFSQASTEARKSSVKSNLQMIRSQIMLYKTQHGDALPAKTDLITALTSKTDYDGTVNTSGLYGPYMQKFPANALNELGDATDGSEITELTTVGASPTVSTTTGWAYNSTTGDFFAVNSTESLGW